MWAKALAPSGGIGYSVASKLKTNFNMSADGIAVAGAVVAGPTGERVGEAAPDAPGPRRIVLLGNPNVGKSALFNALTGLRATVSNYPGTTVEVYRGRLSGTGTEVVDSPGLNSLLPLSEDEQVTWDLVRSVRGEGRRETCARAARLRPRRGAGRPGAGSRP